MVWTWRRVGQTRRERIKHIVRRELDPVPFGQGIKLIECIEIHLLPGGSIVSPMKSVPKGLQSVTGLASILDGLAHWEFALFDPLHQVPWAHVGFRYFLNASIKEHPLCLACGTAERLPLPGGSVLPVLANGVGTLLVLPGFGV
jgi:hypothetical protein